MFRVSLKSILAFSFVSFLMNHTHAELNLNGTSQRVILKSSPKFNKGASQGLTIECHIKTTDYNGVIVSRIGKKGHGYTFGLKNGQLMACVVHEPGSSVVLKGYGPIINDDKWHHIALTVKASGTSELNLYVDGKEIKSEKPLPVVRKSWESNEPMIIGWADAYAHTNTVNVGYYKGKIKNLRVWKKGLSKEDLQTNMSKSEVKTQAITKNSDPKYIVADLRFQTGTNLLNDFSSTRSQASLQTGTGSVEKVFKAEASKYDMNSLSIKNISGQLRGCDGIHKVTSKGLRKAKVYTESGSYEYIAPKQGKMFVSVSLNLKKNFSISILDYVLSSGTKKEKCIGIKKSSQTTFSPRNKAVVNSSTDKLNLDLLFEIETRPSKVELVSNIKSTVNLPVLSFELAPVK